MKRKVFWICLTVCLSLCGIFTACQGSTSNPDNKPDESDTVYLPGQSVGNLFD